MNSTRNLKGTPRKTGKTGKTGRPFLFLKEVVVGKMLHDILHTAVENIAELINGINLHILILTEAVQLSAVDIMVGIQVVLTDAALLHGLPQTVIFDHGEASSPISQLTFYHYLHKMGFRIVCVY